MININNPSPTELAQIAIVQQRRLADLQQLPHWSNSQFEEVLFCLQRWDGDGNKWIQEVDALIKLAFDVRVPDVYADKLREIIQHWRDSGQLKTSKQAV